MENQMTINELSNDVIGSAMKVHSKLGPGILESTYETCLEYELRKRGFSVQRQAVMMVMYDDITIDIGYRVDLLVEQKLILELKAVERIIPIHEAQLLTYLKLSGITLGLLINFNVVHLRDGVKRLANGYVERS